MWSEHMCSINIIMIIIIITYLKITIIKAIVCVCVCVFVCLLPCNLGECFVSLLVEPIAGKNASPSDKQLWRFLKNISVAEKS